MDFKTAVTTNFSKYATFTGRARRSEYWFFVLFNVLVSIALGVVSLFLAIPFAGLAAGLGAGILGAGAGFLVSYFGIFVLLSGLYGLAVIIPTVAVTVRRLHDLNATGWFVLIFFLLSFIPILGFFVAIGQIVWYAQKGTGGENKYGPDPVV